MLYAVEMHVTKLPLRLRPCEGGDGFDTLTSITMCFISHKFLYMS